MRRPHLRPISIISIAIALAGLVAVSLAGDTSVPLGHAPAPGTAGLRVHLNPETGRFEAGPPPAAVQLDAETEHALRRDAVGLTETRLADGTVLIHLDGRFQSVSTVHRSAEGKLVVCTDDEERAIQALRGILAAPAAPEVK